MDCPKMAQARKEFVGAGDVAGNLRAQFFRAAEFLFFTKAFPESHFHPLWCARRLKIDQMGFDAERRTIERWADADVRNRAVAARLAIQTRACDIDASSRKKLLFNGEVQGRESEPPAGPRAADYFAGESEGPPQETARMRHVTCSDFPANDRA